MQIAQFLGGSSELREMMKLVGAEDPSVALIMVHHWIYPALLRMLEAEELPRPSILDDGAASGLAGSLFITLPGVECVESVE